MRKLLLLFALVASSVASYADDLVTAKVKDATTIDVCLTNDASYVAFQMDITLPSGVSIDGVEATEDRTDLNGDWDQVEIGGTGYDQSYQLVYNQIDATTNTWRIVGYSLGNHVIEGTSGEAVAVITITGASGVYEVDDIVSGSALANVIFVLESDLSEITLAGSVEAGVTATPGDVTLDGKFLNNDITAAIALVLSETQATLANDEGWSLINADIDGSGTVLVNDVTAIITLVLNAE